MAQYPVPVPYIIANPEKYTGNAPPIARSSWEREFMKYCDHNPDVLEWASEPSDFGSGRPGIPYHDPVRDKQKIYIPDFLVTFIDAQKQKVSKMIEIKPGHETHANLARRGGKDALVQAKNTAKWMAAQAWCMRRGIDFIVLTENELFNGGIHKKTGPVRPTIWASPKKPVVKKPRVPRKQIAKTLSSIRAKQKRVSKAATASRARSTRRARRARKA